MEKRGFTLIELLIVIAIIAILAAGIVIAINPGRHFVQARNSTRLSHMNAIANAVYTYTAEHGGVYPPCIPAYPGNTNVNNCSGDLVPDYISQIPVPPLTGENYMIQFDNAAQNRIRIFSTASEATSVVVIR